LNGCGAGGRERQSLPGTGRVRPPAGGGVERSVNRIEHAIEVAIDLRVPESQHLEPGNAEAFVTLDVPGCLTVMSMAASIDFDDYTLLEADEVEDETMARSLAAEVKSIAPPRAQMHPHFHLLRSDVLAKVASLPVCHAAMTTALKAGLKDCTRFAIGSAEIVA
jgi:hypothetical protein